MWGYYSVLSPNSKKDLATFSLQTGGAKKKLTKRNADKSISRSAERDQRPTALDPCRLLKKAGENFYLLCLC